ncbi:MAG TPA: glyceraldehyde 3-phosphate dehydrogenase NAD-binding domain-containing protein [Streptosporangiaceae bacterium]|nr:glyceraldehyde 3-phosphate dehydrogenase NAD-binding domain-containing protein [Streptosporangiaceae bacterium]
MSGIAIVGFGRIGRSVVKAGLSTKLFTPSVIVDIAAAEAMAPLFEYDTNYGRWRDPVRAEADGLVIGDAMISWIDARNGAPDWAALDVDVVLDCTGRATTRPGAQAHLDAGATRVLVSAPSKTLEDCDAVLLPGINLDTYDPGRHHIVSMASCTTNALAPVIRVLRETVGIRDGFFTTVHAYTNTQSLTDQPMPERRDSWAAAENIIPSSSGAAKALKFIWPELRVTGKAYRVPVRTGSIVELAVRVSTLTTAAKLNEAFVDAATTGPLAGILGVLHEGWASARIVGETKSSVVDLPLTSVSDDDLVTVAAWYDNEAGYAMRLAETVAVLAAD